MATTRRRPIGITILAILAGIAAVFAVVHFLQAIGILPYVIGPIQIRDFNLWYTILWGLFVWMWIWVVRSLWSLDPGGWIFLVAISAFNLLFNFMALLGTTTFADLSLSFLLNTVILIYAMLPGTKEAFGVPA